jgi:hypothetical protein
MTVKKKFRVSALEGRWSWFSLWVQSFHFSSLSNTNTHTDTLLVRVCVSDIPMIVVHPIKVQPGALLSLHIKPAYYYKKSACWLALLTLTVLDMNFFFFLGLSLSLCWELEVFPSSYNHIPLEIHFYVDSLFDNLFHPPPFSHTFHLHFISRRSFLLYTIFCAAMCQVEDA